MWRHIPTVFGGGPSLSADLPEGAAPTPADRADPPSTPTEHADAPHSPVAVPDLVGLSSTDARRLARAARLAVSVEERDAEEHLWGRVVEQDLAPGTMGAPGDIVNLAVGARPRVTVPDIRGRDEDEALSILRDAGLGAERRAVRRSDRVPEGHVVRTRPRPGALVPSGSRVSYVVAAGPREGGQGGHKHGRRNERVARLADGSFLLPERGDDRARR